MTNEDLKDAVFFWGGPFSQWHVANFIVGDFTYCTAEQFMMSEKARLFHDHETFDRIMATDKPREQKALGRVVKNFQPHIWDKEKLDIVYIGNLNKFGQNKDLYDKLCQTGTKVLVEASPYDTVWGIGIGPQDPDRLDLSKWRGENLLGETLMRVRFDLCSGY
jgi:ribA/ribD-fused uncharacterized protein